MVQLKIDRILNQQARLLVVNGRAQAEVHRGTRCAAGCTRTSPSKLATPVGTSPQRLTLNTCSLLSFVAVDDACCGSRPRWPPARPSLARSNSAAGELTGRCAPSWRRRTPPGCWCSRRGGCRPVAGVALLRGGGDEESGEHEEKHLILSKQHFHFHGHGTGYIFMGLANLIELLSLVRRISTVIGN